MKNGAFFPTLTWTHSSIFLTNTVKGGLWSHEVLFYLPLGLAPISSGDFCFALQISFQNKSVQGTVGMCCFFLQGHTPCMWDQAIAYFEKRTYVKLHLCIKKNNKHYKPPQTRGGCGKQSPRQSYQALVHHAWHRWHGDRPRLRPRAFRRPASGPSAHSVAIKTELQK